MHNLRNFEQMDNSEADILGCSKSISTSWMGKTKEMLWTPKVRESATQSWTYHIFAKKMAYTHIGF